MSGTARAGRDGAHTAAARGWTACLAAALVLSAVSPEPARAQERRAGSSSGRAAVPEMATAPTSFRLAPTAGWATWEETPGASSVDAGPMFGLDLERLLAPFLGARLGLSVGGTASSPSAGGAGTDVRQYALELSLTGRLPVGALGEAGVVPFATAGIGSFVHDPARDDLVTKSQSAFTYGAGLELDHGFLTAAGARLEWRRSRVEFEGVLDPTRRSGRDRRVDRFLLAVYWEL